MHHTIHVELMIYTRGGQLAVSGPQRFQWPAEAFRKNGHTLIYYEIL